MVNDAINQRVKQVQATASQGNHLRIVPICGLSSTEPPYKLLDAATQEAAKVTEISAAGSVLELKVENTLDVRVYLMDGQELVGAKQNRILNTDVLVPAKTTLTIPVSCVEQGRWQSVSAQFSPGKSASYRTRAAKSERIHTALKSGWHHDADQGEVWDEVQSTLAACGTVSPTSALSDAYAMRDAELKSFRRQLHMPKDAVGLAVFHGEAFMGLDLFDRHSTLQYFWDSLVDSYALDWLGASMEAPVGKHGEESEAHPVLKRILQDVTQGNWEPFSSPGEGQDFRLQSPEFSGSALIWEGRVVLHLQVFPRQSGGHAGNPCRPRIHRPYGHGPGAV